MFEQFEISSDGPRIVLFLAALALWITCFVLNKNALDALKAGNKSVMKHQAEQLRNSTWALYVVYLLSYFLNVSKPIFGMVSNRTSVSVIGILLSTILVVCITHVTNTCTDDSCDMKTAMSNLERMNILLGILVAIHVGTIVVTMMTSKNLKYGFTAEIMELLRTPSKKRRSPMMSPRVPLAGSLDYDY